MKKALFGPGGNEELFSKQYKSSIDAPEYLHKMGLDAYEYQCGRGVNISEDSARLLGEKAKAYNIELSLHSPYFINLSSREDTRREKNIKYIIDSCRAASFMGATRVVVHCGGLSGLSREEALANTIHNVKDALAALDENGLGHITLCIETMGKINVLGTLEEVIEICNSDGRLLPCIDFGHLNARTHGGLDSIESFSRALDTLIAGIGYDRASRTHVHFSRIEYSGGGEVRHIVFDDKSFGPEPSLISLMAEKKLYPTVICESAGTQAQDALILKKHYNGEL